ncbi:MAG TPA: aminomethyl-transferring glycine dehydrogenase subunit GcvPA [Desulfobacteria bacterium]|nr:aminomethyl-transferring glycine dehydrogenase subunit GcvPA [Desulfobacteria bacterium]
MRYIPHTETDIQEMLSAIGIKKIGELFQSIPEALRLEAPLDLPPALPEADLTQALSQLASRNVNLEECSVFLGAGAYRHFTPSVVNHLLLRGEFLTSYTPYQPEVSQGTLQAIFEFQSFVCMLTGMEIANASIYDGASSLAEAVLMAHRVNNRNEVLMARTVHPEYRQVVETYTRGIEFKIIEAPYQENGQTDLEFIKQHVTDDTSSVVIQSPNFFGIVEQYAELGKFLKEKETLLIVVVAEATSLGILKPPGERGADIVAGEGQGWGLPVSYGGPHVGFFATQESFFRQVPGRIVGETVDRAGQRSYALTLATREQHIRREKATSNICTNQGLCALAATIWLAAMGKQGVREVALQNLKTANALKDKLQQLKGFGLRFLADTYNEFVLECPGPAQELHAKLLAANIVAGLPLGNFYPELDNCLLLCATEMNSRESLDHFANQLGSM